MSPEKLLSIYDRVVDAPDAVPRLRQFILDLAVRGKLVEQDSNDEPASQLLKQIEVEKARLVAVGEIRKLNKLLPIASEPFRIPAKWLWVRIRKATSAREQKVPDSDFTYIDVTTIDKEAGVVTKPKQLTKDEAPNRARKIVAKGDVIYSCVRPYLLNVAVLDQEFDPAPIASTAFAVLNGHGFVMPWYIWIVLRSSFMINCVVDAQRGQAYPAINDKDFAQLPFPLPPLTEQHRIVTKVNQLMVLCDQLEENKNRREMTRYRLTTAAYTGLCTGDTDKDTFRGHARLAIEALPTLTARPDQIKQLRQFILDLAVRGKLVKQDSGDEPISKLLKRIEKEIEKERQKDHENRRLLTPIDLPFFLIPDHWACVRLDQISMRLHYGFTASASKFRRDIRLLRITDIQNDHVDWTTVPGCEISIEDYPKFALESGDLLIARTGGTIGKTFLVSEVPVKSIFASYLIRIQLVSSVLSEYIKLFCGSDVYWHQLRQGSRGGAQPNVNGSTLSNMHIPLPPLAEQHRIVAKVDELMALCDQLEENLNSVDNGRTDLLESLLRDALEPAANESDATESSTLPISHGPFQTQGKQSFQDAP